MCRAEHRLGARLATPALALLAAVAVALSGAPRAARSQPVEASDDSGARVALASPARRIVSLAPHLTELLFAAGAGDRVVGVVAWSDFPPAARRLPRVGDSALLDLERIAALQPDLVVAWGSGTPASQVARLAALGLTVYRSEPRRSGDIAATLRRLGTLAGSAEAAEARAAAFEREMQALRSQYAGRAPLRVAYQIWHQPLMTVSDRHLIAEALETCGARNVFGALPGLTPTISAEAVVAADPDVIVAAGGDADGRVSLAPWRALPTLRATRAGALVAIDPDRLHRATDRFAAGTRALCEALDGVRGQALRR